MGVGESNARLFVVYVDLLSVCPTLITFCDTPGILMKWA